MYGLSYGILCRLARNDTWPFPVMLFVKGKEEAMGSCSGRLPQMHEAGGFVRDELHEEPDKALLE
jgi:hypothetical protein